MSDADAPIHPVRNEPVALLDIAKAVVAVAAFAGIEWADETVLQIVVGVNAAIVLVAATLATRRRVTPEPRAVAREQVAYADGLEVGTQQAPAVATVVQVSGDDVFTDVDRLVPRYPPPPPAPPVEQLGERGRAGLLDFGERP